MIAEQLYNLLNVTALTDLVGENIYFDRLPEGFDFDNDAVIFTQALNNVNKDLEGNTISKSYYITVKAFSRDSLRVLAIAQATELLFLEDVSGVFQEVNLNGNDVEQDKSANVWRSETTINATVGASVDVSIIDPNKIVYNRPIRTPNNTVIFTGDAVDIENKVFASERASSQIGRRPELVDYATLQGNNAFGNTMRFTDNKGGAQFGAIHDQDAGDENNTPQSGYVEYNQGDITDDLGVTKSNCFRYYPNGISTSHWFNIGNYAPASYGSINYQRNVNISGWIYSPSSNSVVMRLLVFDRYVNTGQNVLPTAGQWVYFSLNYERNDFNTRCFIYRNGQSTVYAGSDNPNDDVVYISGLKVTQTPDNGSVRNYTIDNYTGLGWELSIRGNNTIENALLDCLGSDLGGANEYLGYKDWFLPSDTQVKSVQFGYSGSYPSVLYYYPFYLNSYFLTSSKSWYSSRWRTAYADGALSRVYDTQAYPYLACRKHF